MTASCWKSFFPNTATDRPISEKSFATTVVTPSKWPGSVRPAEMGGEVVDTDARAFAGDVHRVGLGREDDVDALELPDVALEVARIAREILVWTELGRIHEDRADDERGAPPRLLHQREVPVVQRAHRGHEAHLEPARAGRVACLP